MTEPTLKQWKRRALAAEAELDALRTIMEVSAAHELGLARENAYLRVAIKEVQEATNWVYGAIAERLGDTT